MAMLTEPNQTLKREDISDEMIVVDLKKTPLFASIRKGDAPNDTLFEQPVDALDAPQITGRPDGKDVASNELANPGANRAKVPARCQWFLRAPGVGKIAGMTNVAGVGKRMEYPKAVVKYMTVLKRDIEATTVSVRDSAADDGTNGSLTRGLGMWMHTTAQGNDPVPAGYITPTAQVIGCTSAAGITETILIALGEALWKQCGEKRDYEMPMTITAKAAVTDMTRLSPNVSGNLQVSRFTAEVSEAKFTRTVDIYEGDFATFNMYAHPFMDETLTNTLNQLAYALAEELMEYRVMQNPMHEELPNNGGGRKGQIDAILGLVYKNPLLGGRLTTLTING